MNINTICHNEASHVTDYIIALRRKIHRYPELGFEEKATCALIEQELAAVGLTTSRCAGTGIICDIKGAAQGPIVALRADIDGLAVHEDTDCEFQSVNPGKMHACGHDAHTAMLVTAARILNTMKKQFSGTIRCIFQPAEEGGGGAASIIKEGGLDKVQAIFGIHVWADTPSGIVQIKKGPLLASSDCFTLTVNGTGGHAAAPHLTADPTAVIADIYNALQKLISREVDPFEPAVLSTPMLNGSAADNVIPSAASLSGTLRTFNNELRNYLKKRIETVADGYARAWRCSAALEFEKVTYPPLVNDEQLAGFMLSAIGESHELLKAPSMGAEDFSFYARQIPGLMVLLGTYNKDKDCVYAHHHPRFNIDEDILSQGAALYCRLGLHGLAFAAGTR